MSEIIIGIDLGTTNSEVAVFTNGVLSVLEVEGSKLLPSVVGLADDGSLLVGQAARNQLALYPERTIRSIKRSMGQDIKVHMGVQQHTPQEISALILSKLRKTAEKTLGVAVNKAVITVPAYFSDAQRQATRDAGELAGLEVVRIINEPTAAALAYEAGHKEQRTILVYDLGGGTFDVSVVRMEQGVTEVLASHGDNHLGGDDFDACIVKHLVEWLQRERNCDPQADRVAMARLGRAAETAKIALSDVPFVNIEEEYLLDKDGKPVHLTLELSRSDYEDMIADYVTKTIDAVHIAMRGANTTVSDLDEVLLVGGATRTPFIQSRLERELKMQPRFEVDPDLCVAAGAAIQAAMIAGQQVSNVLVDITPYTFGTSAVAECDGEFYPYTFVPLIRKNSAIPITKSEAFNTLVDNQSAIDVKIYQGEDEDALKNTEIGAFKVDGLSRVPAGNVIVLTFSLDLNGILQVSAQEKRTGLQKHIRIDNATARFKQEELVSAQQRIAALLDQQQDSNQEQRESVQIQALIEKAERLLDNAGAGGVGCPHISEDDREDLVNMIEKLREAVTANDNTAMSRFKAELADLIFYLES